MVTDGQEQLKMSKRVLTHRAGANDIYHGSPRRYLDHFRL